MQNNNQMLVRMWNNNSHLLLVEMQNSLWKTGSFLKNQACNLWHLPKWTENLCPHETWTWTCIIALFIIAKTWKQQRCPSIGKWINRLWCIQTMDYYSVLNINALSNYKKTWRNLKCILLSERSQFEKATHYDSKYMTFW